MAKSACILPFACIPAVPLLLLLLDHWDCWALSGALGGSFFFKGVPRIQEPLAGNSLRTFFIFSGGTSLFFFGLSLALLGALVGAKWWGKVVGFDCLILSQIGLILTELC